MKSLKILPFLLLTSSLFSQTLLRIKHSCNYYGQETEKEHYLFEATAEARQIIEEVIQFSGLSATIKAHESNCANALATSDGKQRLILYNPNFLRQFKQDARTKWAAYCVLAHEVAHHLNFHDLEENDPSVRKRFELEADRFAGFILYRMGATVVEAQLGIQTLQSENASNTHPPKSARLVAIANGWTKAYDQSGGVQPKPVLSSVATKPTPSVLKQDYTEMATGVPFKMVFVKGGTFKMGSNDKEAEDREKPIHNVTVSNFYMGKTEVTHKEWRAIMGGERTLMGGSSYNLDIISCDDCPIELVSWDECQTFLEKLNNKTGKNYRLPTEAEWEYAAKGGNQSKGYKYAGSNDIDKVAWYWRNSGDKKLTGEWGSDEHNKNNCKTHPVAQKQANELGLYDMSGNVYEWCQDRHEPYGVKTVINPTKEKDLVLRGGDWRDNDAGDCRTSSRSNAMHYVQFMGFGFRIALSSN